MVLVLIILGMVALFYFLFALAYILEPLVGGLMVSFGIIAAINILLIAIVIIFRKKLIISPMVNFLAGLFLNENTKTSPSLLQKKLGKIYQELQFSSHWHNQFAAITSRQPAFIRMYTFT